MEKKISEVTNKKQSLLSFKAVRLYSLPPFFNFPLQYLKKYGILFMD